MVELIVSFATFIVVLLLGLAALTASLSVAAAQLLRYGAPACCDAG